MTRSFSDIDTDRFRNTVEGKSQCAFHYLSRAINLGFCFYHLLYLHHIVLIEKFKWPLEPHFWNHGVQLFINSKRAERLSIPTFITWYVSLLVQDTSSFNHVKSKYISSSNSENIAWHFGCYSNDWQAINCGQCIFFVIGLWKYEVNFHKIVRINSSQPTKICKAVPWYFFVCESKYR